MLLQNFDKANIKEETMLEAFEYLNRPLFDASKVSKINKSLSKIVNWGRYVVSYHILIHPYRVRNFSTISEDSDLFRFANFVDHLMDKFYKLKAYLMKIEIMPRDTNFAFNLSHVRLANKETEPIFKKVSEGIIAEVLTFLPAKEALMLNLVSKKWKASVSEHWDIRLAMFISEIEN